MDLERVQIFAIVRTSGEADFYLVIVTRFTERFTRTISQACNVIKFCSKLTELHKTTARVKSQHNKKLRAPRARNYPPRWNFPIPAASKHHQLKRPARV